MRQIYSILLYLLTPFLILRLIWKGQSTPAYRQRIGERFVLGKMSSQPVDLWIHAVSLGEVRTIVPFVNALLSSNHKILITTMTATGSQAVLNHFGKKVSHQYVPYDLPFVVRRFYRRIKPKAAILVEKELWPNLCYFAPKFKIPLFLVNATISSRSYQAYKKITYLMKPLLRGFSLILVQTPRDASRFLKLGAVKKQIHVLGNMKFDLSFKQPDFKHFTTFPQQWGQNRVVFMAASTHDNEEALILAKLRCLQAAIPNLLFLLAPRHPARFQTIFQLSCHLGFKTALRSDANDLSSQTEVLILDCIGELLYFYKLSHYAFVGGSLVPIGGHNILEPIAMQVPVFSGPWIDNFKQICQTLLNANAIEIVNDAADLVAKIKRLHENETQKISQIQNANQILLANQGVVIKYKTKIERYLQYTLATIS